MIIFCRNILGHFKKCCVFLLVSYHTQALEAYFIDARGNSHRIEDSELCITSGLQGLNRTRELLNISDCTSEARTETALSNQIDVLILVDDQAGVNDSVAERIDSLPGQQLICRSSAHRYLYPGYFILRRAEDQLRILVVGEHIIRTYFADVEGSEPLAQYLQKVIQQTGVTSDSGISPSVSRSAANNIPVGKGLFELQVMNRLVPDRYSPYKMDHMASNFHNNQLNWFAITSNVAGMCDARLYTEFIRFGHPSFQLFVWKLNEPENPESQIDEMIEAAKNIRANGIIIDIEGSFRRHNPEARALYRVAREKVEEFNRRSGASLSLGVTIIGFSEISEYLTQSDLESADFLMPQIYNRGDNLSETQINQRINFWLNTFSSRPVVLLAGAHHCSIDSAAADQGCSSQRSKTAIEFATSLAPFAGRAANAIGWWRYGNVEEGDHWEMIREFEFNE